MLGGVQGSEQPRHLVEPRELVRLGQEPDRLGGERRRRQVERDELEPLLAGDRLALVAHDLLGHLDLSERQVEAEPPFNLSRRR